MSTNLPAWIPALLVASPIRGQDLPVEPDSLLISAASYVVEGGERASGTWPSEWFQGEFILFGPGGEAVAVLAEPLVSIDQESVPAHRFSGAHEVVYVLPPGHLDVGPEFAFPSVEGRQLLTAPPIGQLYSIDDPVLATVVFVYHELFHLHQFQNRWLFEAQLGGGEHPPAYIVRDERFRELAGRERELLSAALELDDPDSIRTVASTYLELRRERMGLLDRGYRVFERETERLEGSAQLVGYMSALFAVEGSAEGLVELIQWDLDNAPDFSPASPSGPYRRWHMPSTGAAIGLLLDELGVAWRDRLEGGESFEGLLTEAVTVSVQSQ